MGGKTYRDAATATRQETLQSGEKLTIVYVRDNPNVSTELGAEAKLKNDLAFVIASTVVFPTLLIFLFQRFLLSKGKHRWQERRAR